MNNPQTSRHGVCRVAMIALVRSVVSVSCNGMIILLVLNFVYIFTLTWSIYHLCNNNTTTTKVFCNYKLLK